MLEKTPVLPSEYYAAIDLGSNSCRLLITKATEDKLIHVESYSRIIRLGEGMVHSGRISDVAIERALFILQKSMRRLKNYPAVNLRCVATEVCRKAVNTDAFLSRIAKETNLHFTVINEEEEARLTARGIASLRDPHFPYTVVMDVGGGSTEIVLLKTVEDKPVILGWMSLPLGVVSLAESENLESAQSYFKITEMIRQELRKFGELHQMHDLIDQNQVQFIGSSGTATTAAAIHLGLRFYDREKIDGLVLTFEEVENVIKNLQMMSREERALHPCIGPERSDLILGGMAIFEGLSTAWPIGKITVADRGVRDGIVQELYEQRNNSRQ